LTEAKSDFLHPSPKEGGTSFLKDGELPWRAEQGRKPPEILVLTELDWSSCQFLRWRCFYFFKRLGKRNFPEVPCSSHLRRGDQEENFSPLPFLRNLLFPFLKEGKGGDLRPQEEKKPKSGGKGGPLPLRIESPLYKRRPRRGKRRTPETFLGSSSLL